MKGHQMFVMKSRLRDMQSSLLQRASFTSRVAGNVTLVCVFLCTLGLDLERYDVMLGCLRHTSLEERCWSWVVCFAGNAAETNASVNNRS